MVGRPRSQPAAWLGRPCQPQDGKGKFVCPGGSRRRPSMVSKSQCRTGNTCAAAGRAAVKAEEPKRGNE